LLGNRVSGLHRGDAQVEPAQEVLVPVHAAIGGDVELAAVQQDHADRVRERAQLVALREDLLVGHPLHDEVGCVVGDRVVLVAAFRGGGDHSLQGDDAVGEVGVRVQVPAQVGDGNELSSFSRNEAASSPSLPRSAWVAPVPAALTATPMPRRMRS
jgi:hypothetical protein